MNHLTYGLLIGALLASTGALRAQQYFSLDDYRERVMSYSQQLKQARESVTSATAKRKADRTGFLPRIDLAGSGSIDLTNLDLWNAPAGTYHPYTYFGGGVLSQPLYAGGSLQAQYQADKLQEEVSRQNVELTLDNVTLQADMAYWTLAANIDLLRIARQYEGIIQSQYDIIKLRFDDGAIAKNDLLMITTRLKETELSVKKAEVSYLVACQNFNILMGEAPDSQRDETESIMRPVAAPEEVTFEQALAARPDYRTAELNVGIARQSQRLALSKFMPQLSLSVQGGFGTSNPNLGPDGKPVALPSISFSMPLFHWGERAQVKSQYRALYNSSLYARQIVADQVNKELCNARTNMDQSFTQIRVAEENLRLAQEALDLNTFSYNEGKITIADVLSSQLAWINAYTSLISAHYAYKSAVAQYIKASGR